MTYPSKDITEYIIALVNEFAQKFELTDTEAYRYMRIHHAIDFVEQNYGALHTLDFDEVLDNVTNYCRKNGGLL